MCFGFVLRVGSERDGAVVFVAGDRTLFWDFVDVDAAVTGGGVDGAFCGCGDGDVN